MSTITYTDPLDLSGWSVYDNPNRTDQQGPRLKSHVVATAGSTNVKVPASVKSSTLTTNPDGSLELVCEIEPPTVAPGPPVNTVAIDTAPDNQIKTPPGYASGGMMLVAPKLAEGMFLEWEFSFSAGIGIKCACGLWTTGDTKTDPSLYYEYDMFECSAPDRSSMFVTNHWYEPGAGRQQKQVPGIAHDFRSRTLQRIEWDAAGIRNYVGVPNAVPTLVANHTDHLPTVPMSVFLQTALTGAPPQGQSFLDIYRLQIGEL